MGTIRTPIGSNDGSGATGTVRPRITRSGVPQVIPTTTTPAKEPRKVAANTAANGGCIPIAYGAPAPLGGIPIMYGFRDSDGGFLVVYVFCSGPIESYSKVEIGGIDVTSVMAAGGTVSGIICDLLRLGTNAQTVSTLIQSVYADHVETYANLANGLCYLAVVILPGSQVYGGIPEARITLEGRNDVYTAETAGVPNTPDYTKNAAWILAHLITCTDGGRLASSAIDWASVDDCATALDRVLSNGVSGVIANRSSLETHVSGLLAQCMAFAQWRGGKLSFAPITPLVTGDSETAAFTITEAWVVASNDGRGPLQAQEWEAPPQECPNRIAVAYSEEDRDGEMDERVAEAGAVASGTQEPWELDVSAPWLTDATSAQRHAEDKLAEGYSNPERCELLCNRRALVAERGDICATSGITGIQDRNWLVKDAVVGLDGTVRLVLQATWARSTATRVVDTKPTITLPPKPGDEPPPVANSGAGAGLPVLAVTTGQGASFDRYSIEATWAASPSGLVRGYRVYLWVDGVDSAWRLFTETGRSATGAVIDVEYPQAAHDVAICPVSMAGTEGNVAAGAPNLFNSITPGAPGITPAVACILAEEVMSILQQRSSPSNVAGYVYQLTYQLSAGSYSDILYVDVRHTRAGRSDEPIVTTFRPTGFSYVILAPFKTSGLGPVSAGGQWGSSFMFLSALASPYPGDVIYFDSVLTDGTIVSTSITLPATTSTGYISADQAGNAEDLTVFLTNGGMVSGAVGAAPTARVIPWYGDGSRWLYKRKCNGIATITDTNSYVTVTIGITMPTSTYRVLLGAEANNTFWVSNKTTTTFRINRPTTSGAQDCAWTVEQEMP